MSYQSSHVCRGGTVIKNPNKKWIDDEYICNKYGKITWSFGCRIDEIRENSK